MRRALAQPGQSRRALVRARHPSVRRELGGGAANWEAITSVGGAATFVELDGADKTTAAGEGLADGVWGDWDISGIIPVGTLLVLIGVYKIGAIDWVGVRKGGTALVRTFELEAPTTAFIPTLPSATRTIGIMSTDVSDGDEFCVFGYWVS